jgi:hypothetical protein
MDAVGNGVSNTGFVAGSNSAVEIKRFSTFVYNTRNPFFSFAV